MKQACFSKQNKIILNIKNFKLLKIKIQIHLNLARQIFNMIYFLLIKVQIKFRMKFKYLISSIKSKKAKSQYLREAKNRVLSNLLYINNQIYLMRLEAKKSKTKFLMNILL